ncbi:MAG: Hsp33 family molecular chaperone HslO [Chitinophagaceae bacterium]|nr:Hsp33 family molecular chaperone HslO [Oligoflexus sp.]
MTKVQKYLSTDGTIRISTVISTDLANEAFRYLEASPLAKVLTSRALTAAVLMASQLKEGLSLSLHFQGEGPVKSIFAAATYDGSARAYCENRGAELPEGVTKIGAGLGRGALEVALQQPHDRQPHVGAVELLSGEIGDDVAYYLGQSQQIPSIVALAAIPLDDGMEVAGGYILELMPGYTDDTVRKLEALSEMTGVLTERIQQGATASELIDVYLMNFKFEEIEHPHEIHYRCGCNVDRVERSILLLGPTTLDDMIASEEDSEVRCEFCGKLYTLATDELIRLRQTLPTIPLN